MNDADDFFDFMIFYELMFPDDEDREIKCPHCGRVIKGSEKVGWVEKGKIFKCPECEEEVNV
jgi:predicted RNA-binding Zn-ribbon protein involved in translation (DUF1610 family)